MTDNRNLLSISDTLRFLETDNAALRLKLARHEFRQMQQELRAEHPFKMDVYTGDAPAPPPDIVIPEGDSASLPHLPVPMGTIQAEATATNLPVIGIYDDRLTGSPLAAALLGLLTTQYQSPFARFVFVCSSFEAVPFLGRYGFIFEQIGTAAPAAVMDRLNRRYGAAQIRSLDTGAVIVEHGGA